MVGDVALRAIAQAELDAKQQPMIVQHVEVVDTIHVQHVVELEGRVISRRFSRFLMKGCTT